MKKSALVDTTYFLISKEVDTEKKEGPRYSIDIRVNDRCVDCGAGMSPLTLSPKRFAQFCAEFIEAAKFLKGDDNE